MTLLLENIRRCQAKKKFFLAKRSRYWLGSQWFHIIREASLFRDSIIDMIFPFKLKFQKCEKAERVANVRDVRIRVSERNRAIEVRSHREPMESGPAFLIVHQYKPYYQYEPVRTA